VPLICASLIWQITARLPSRNLLSFCSLLAREVRARIGQQLNGLTSHRGDAVESVKRHREVGPGRFIWCDVSVSAHSALRDSCQTQALIEAHALREEYQVVARGFGVELGYGETGREAAGDATDFGCLLKQPGKR
jgi:hypothetical protein